MRLPLWDGSLPLDSFRAVRVPATEAVGPCADITRNAKNDYCTLSGSQISLVVWQQYDLAEHSAFAQHLVCAARVFERQPSRDQGLDFALFE